MGLIGDGRVRQDFHGTLIVDALWRLEQMLLPGTPYPVLLVSKSSFYLT